MKIKKICAFMFFMCLSSLVHLKTSDAITFGQSADLEGSFRLYGNMIKTGILARMYRLNDQGGINGKKLKLISLNDSGDPLLTQKNVDILLKQGVDMFIGNMGTRSILKVLPLIKSGQIAMFFPWGGDEQLRNSALTNIINGPGLLNEQLIEIVDYVEKNIKLHKIAIFCADDDFSVNGANFLDKELVKRTKQKPVIAYYNRFTMDINKAANTLLESDPKIIICISTSMPVEKLINIFFREGHYGTKFFGIDSTLLAGFTQQPRGVDFYYTAAVSDPIKSSMPIAKQYLEDLKKYFPDETPNVLSFTYYVSMSIIVQAIKEISGPITKEKIISVIEKMKNSVVDGFMVNFDSTNRHAFGRQISIIKG